MNAKRESYTKRRNILRWRKARLDRLMYKLDKLDPATDEYKRCLDRAEQLLASIKLNYYLCESYGRTQP